jgi:hypothetical protein
VKSILDIFGEASGLKCNFRKSSIPPIFGHEDVFQELSGVMDCQAVGYQLGR